MICVLLNSTHTHRSHLYVHTSRENTKERKGKRQKEREHLLRSQIHCNAKYGDAYEYTNTHTYRIAHTHIHNILSKVKRTSFTLGTMTTTDDDEG